MHLRSLFLITALVMSTLPLAAQVRSARTALPPEDLFQPLTNKSAPAELLAELAEFSLFTADAETYASFRDAAPMVPAPALELDDGRRRDRAR